MVTLRQRGFNLIEMMVVIAIMALLSMIAAPFTTAWIDAARVRESTHRLVEAMAHAKSLALRNGGAVAGDTPSAVLIVADSKLCVYGATPAAVKCTNQAAWTSAASAQIALNGASFQCVALNNMALPVDVVIDSVACGHGSYSISRGNERYPADGTNALN